jgi:diguanylate cyclase (GGDEF)-like protein
MPNGAIRYEPDPVSKVKGQLQEHLEGSFKSATKWCSIVALSIGIVSLVAWYSGSLNIARLRPDYIPIAPSTAVCSSILSASLLFYVLQRRTAAIRLVTLVGSFIVALISVTVIVGFLFGKTFEFELMGIQSHEYFAHVPIGHMSPLTACTLFIAALACMLLVFSLGNRRDYRDATGYIATAIISIGFIIILGYLYGTPLLYGGNIIPVAVPSAITFELIGIGLLTASGPRALPIRVFTGSSVRSRLMRAFPPVIIAFVIVEGWLYGRLLHGDGNPALISAVIAILSAVAIGAVMSSIAKAIGSEIDRANSERDLAVEMLKLDEDRLETLLRLSHLKVQSEKDLTDFALEESVRITDSKGGYLHFFNEDQQTIQLFSWSKDVLKTCTATQNHNYPLASAGVWADSIRLRRAVIHNDYQSLTDKKGYPEGHFHLIRHLGVPIFDKDRVVGVTGVGNKEEPYNEADARQITLFMDHVWKILKERRAEKEREELILKLQDFSFTDELTGLYNRRGLYSLAEHTLKMSNRSEQGFFLLYADLDGLKTINDTLGHKVGDMILVRAAHVLKETFRDSDIIARTGGDEFVVLPIENGGLDINVVISRLQRNIDINNSREAPHHKISMSVGVAFYDPDSRCSLDELLTGADNAMYENKKLKKGGGPDS